MLVPVFIAAGQWQWNKASVKAEMQRRLDVLAEEPAVQIPTEPVSSETLRYRKVVARGTYEPQRQILVDNRTYRQQAGFHVVTPLRVEGGEMRVLVNRGWVPVLAGHGRVPDVATPTGIVEVSGQAIVPPSRFFTLADERDEGTWRTVWQNLDMDRYARLAGFPVQPAVIQLDPQSAGAGFVREWPRPDDRRSTNLGYAFQWWSFAATTVALWLYHGFRRKH